MEIKKSNTQTYLAVFLIFFAVAAPFATCQCDTTSPSYVNLTQLPNYSGDVNLCSYAGQVQDSDGAKDFFWYFPAVNQLIEPPLLIFINNVGESSLSALFLEQGPLEFTSLNGQNINIVNRASSWSNFMNVLYIDTGYTGGFVQTPTVFNPQATTYGTYLFESLNRVFEQLKLNPATIGPISLYARGLSAQVAVQAKYQAFNGQSEFQITSLILDNPFLDQSLQQGALLQGALGLGLFSTEQSNIAEAYIQGCRYSATDIQVQTICLAPSVYFEKETSLNSKDVRQNLNTANSYNSRRTYLQNYLKANTQNLRKTLHYNINEVQLLNEYAYKKYQTFYVQYANTLNALQTLLNNHQSVAVLAGQFNLQASVSGLTQIISRCLGFSSYTQFPLKQNYYAQKMANQVTGQQFGYYYSWGASNTFNFIVSQSGAYIDNERWLNASSELVYNLASGQNYLCSITQQTCQVSTKIKQDAMKNCNGNGVFNQQTGVCNCNLGFALADCSAESIQIQTEQSQLFVVKPRQWWFFWINTKNPGILNYLLEIKSNSTELFNVELSYSGFSAGTFQDFAGITSNIQASGIGHSNQIQIPFPQRDMTFISIQNPSFFQSVSYSLQVLKLSLNINQQIPGPSTWQSPNAGYVASIVMFSLGCALLVAGFFIWFLGTRPLNKKFQNKDEIVLTTEM